MGKEYIEQFMWGYQESFRRSLARLGESVLNALGAEVRPKAFLIGVLAEDVEATDARYLVCIEPEDDTELVQLFSGLREQVVEAVPKHELQKMFYGDAQTMRDKPERIRRIVLVEEAANRLNPYDHAHGVRSFVGYPARIGDYRVAPVLQVPSQLFSEFPTLRSDGRGRMSIYKSLIEAAVVHVLEEGSRELELPDSGRFFDRGTRSAEEVVLRAADAFLRAPAILITEQMPDYDLFSILNNISLMRYEHGEGVGRLLLASSSHPKIDFLLKLAEPIALRDARWARKMLEMAEGSVAVIADSRKIYGLGVLGADHNAKSEDAFWIDFLGHHQWDFGNGDQILMRTRYGSPLLPQETISEARFTDNMIRQFASCDPERLWSIFQTLLHQERGAMLIIADDAAEEADRLGGQGTKIVPTLAEGELIAAATRIDGSILVDPLGHCHAIGIILDGTANNLGSGARGSRFNSAMRYVAATDQVRVAVVISEDRTVDIHPLLRRKIDRDLVERNLVALENASIDDFYEPREFINQNRFYLLPEQCERANAALIRINELPAPVGRIKWTTKPLEPDPEMNEGYFL